MLSRATRPIGAETPQVGQPHVGPATYGAKPLRKFADRDGHAPFGNLTSREHKSLFETSNSQWPAPDPAQYNVVKYSKPTTAIGGSTLADKASRWSSATTDVPDPGSYDVRGSIRKQKNGSKGRVQKPAGGVTMVRKHNPAAIPAREETRGYQEVDGELVKHPRSQAKDEDIGPGRYNVLDPAQTKSKYSDFHFGSRTSNRVLKTTLAQEGPAPGNYDVAPIGKFTAPVRMKREPRQVIASSTRDMDLADTKHTMYKPGPNSYSMPKTFKTAKVPTHLQFFGSTSTRFGGKPARADVPAPGTYEETRQALKKTNVAKVDRQDRCPFGQSAVRFDRPHPVRFTPGPAVYNTESWSTGHSGVTKSVLRTRNLAAKGGFGTIAERSAPFGNSELESRPAPGRYTVNRGSKGGAGGAVSSFSSGSSQRPAPVGQDSVPPNMYTIDPPALPTETASNTARPDLAKTKAFVSKDKRFASHGQTQLKPDSVNPSPGAYTVVKMAGKTPGLITDQRKPRFAAIRTEAPAPNTYSLEGIHKHSTLKPSFNVTFDS